MEATTIRRIVNDRVRVRNALISVADKTGLGRFVRALTEAGQVLTLYATGGTLAELKKLLAGGTGQLSVAAIEDYTRYPEMPGGLVKTLHPLIHGGLLGDLDQADQAEHMQTQGMITFDLVVVNLYPFAETVARSETTLEDARRQIDIGGPTMLRAGAKNFLRVAVISDPADYGPVVREYANHQGTIGLDTRWWLAQKAFRHVLAYDEAIAGYLDRLGPEEVRQAYAVGESAS